MGRYTLIKPSGGTYEPFTAVGIAYDVSKMF